MHGRKTATSHGSKVTPQGMEKMFFDLPQNDFLSVQEVARFLDISLRTVYRLCREGVFQGVGLNQPLRISRDSLLQYIEDGLGK